MWLESLRSRIYEFFWLLRERARWRKIDLDHCIMCGADISHTNAIVFFKAGYPDYAWCWSCYRIHGPSDKEIPHGQKDPIIN